MNRGAVVWLAVSLGGCAVPSLLPQTDVYNLPREAQLAYEGGDDQQTEKLMQSLLRAAPNDAETWFRLGNLYARSNRYADAEDAFQHALLLKPSDARAWHNVGIVHIRQATQAMLQAQALAGDDEIGRAHV